MKRIALGIEYNGSAYRGWQRQEEVLSIQACVEAAVSRVADHSIRVTCAGRTDAGVHASMQVAHFDTQASRTDYAWVWGSNSFLPPDIRIWWAQEINPDFHARFSAIARCYRYVIYNQPIHSAIFINQVSSYHLPLAEHLMHEAAQYLVGEHDFTSFRGADCQSKSPIRKIENIKVWREHHLVYLEVKANAFLHHMVRNIVGVLFSIGAGLQPRRWMKEVLDKKDRRKAGVTAEPAGLYLVSVDYPENFNIPKRKNFHQI